MPGKSFVTINVDRCCDGPIRWSILRNSQTGAQTIALKLKAFRETLVSIDYLSGYAINIDGVSNAIGEMSQ